MNEPPPYHTLTSESQSSSYSTDFRSTGSSSSSTLSASTLGTTNTNTGTRRMVKLASNSQEKKFFDLLANLFSIIKTVEVLETQYSNCAVALAEYRQQCSLLISHFKTARKKANMIKDEDVQKFMKDYRLECPLAYTRLVEVGVPDSGSGGGGIKVVAETVQHFITLKDALSLNMSAIDEIQPLLADLVDSAARSLIQFPGFDRLQNWLVDLNKMKATAELDGDQRRQMMHDLETAYSNFHKNLGVMI